MKGHAYAPRLAEGRLMPTTIVPRFGPVAHA